MLSLFRIEYYCLKAVGFNLDMKEQAATKNSSRDTTLVWCLFLTAAILALMVKTSRLGEEGILVNAVLWNSLPSFCFVFGLNLLGILFQTSV